MPSKQKSLPHFPFYPTDFVSKTTRLTDEEVGAYMRLLCEQWIAGDLPSVTTHDGTHVPKVLKMISESLDTSWDAISKYFEVDGDTMKNPRLEKERVKAVNIYNKRVKAGKASAESRATHDPTSVDTTQNSEPITNKTEDRPQKRETRKRFTPPLFVDVLKRMTDSNYKNTLNLSIAELEAEKFISFYNSNGWMVGKHKMKSWEDSVAGWLARIKTKDVEDVGVISTID